MPCNCDHLDASSLEVEISKVACLIDEIDGKKFNKSHWDGYHPLVYNNCHKELGDKLTSKLCEKLQNLDVKKYSLEMQIWWRDHQRADKERLKKEQNEIKERKAKEKAIKKLTKYERELLGI